VTVQRLGWEFLEVVVSDRTKTGLGISRGGCERRYKDWAGNF